MNRAGLSTLAVVNAAAVLVLAACTSLAPPTPGSGPPILGPVAAPSPVRSDGASFAFAKIGGAPGDDVTIITDTMKDEAQKRKIKVVPENDPSMTYRVKGYFSAVGGPTGTLLVYTLDVLDTNGARVHRVTGQVNGAGTGGDPWAGIKDGTAKTAAKHAIEDLAAWVYRS